MGENEIIAAVAAKLRKAWPARPVYADEIDAEANGCFFVRIKKSAVRRLLAGRRRHMLTLEVRYILTPAENLAFYAWAEEMYDLFLTLDVKAAGKDEIRVLHVSNTRAEKASDRFSYRFLMDIAFDKVFIGGARGTEGEVMETLYQQEQMKD